MKRLIILISFLLAFIFSFGQGYPVIQNIGSDSAIVKSKAAIWGNTGIVNGKYLDTTAANLTRIRQYPFAQIATYSDNNMWVRNADATRWLILGSGAISNSTTSVTILNDSTLIICSGPSNCDTINIGNTINNVSYTYFSNDSTIVFCNASNVCDSVVIPQPITLIGQNGVIIPFPGAFEIGATPFYHATDIYTNGFNFTMNQTQTGSFRIKQNAASNNAILELINPDIAGVELRLLGNGQIRSSNTNISLMGYNDTVNLISQFYGGLTFPPYPNTRNDGPISKALSTDASGNLILGTLNTAPQGCGLQSGGLITWDSLLVFDVAPADYCINDVSYSAPFTTVTLAAGDASFARYDAVIADTNGVISVLQGTPAADPLFPQADPESQLVLSYILVNANETVFSGILQTVIYDEGVEWDTLANGITTNFLNTTNPLHLTHAADVGAITNGDYDQFTYSSTVDLNNYSVLKLYVRLKSTFANNARITFLWMNGNVIINTNTVSIGGNNSLYNFVRTTVGAYQVITIPINAWVLNSTTANRLRIRYTGANAQGIYLDWIQLQGGIQQGQGGPTGIQSLSVTGNPIITAAVTNPTGPNTVVALNLSNACAGCFLANQTVPSAPPTYAPINLSNNGSFTGLLNPAFIDTAPVNGSFLQSLSGVTQWVSLPSGYDTTFVLNGLRVIPGVNNDTLLWGGTLRENTIITAANFYTAISGGRFEEAQGVSLAAANNFTLGAAGNTFTVTGNTQINAITTANWQSGSVVRLIFTGTPTVKNNTAGGAGTATILLGGGVDFVAAANDVLSLEYDGTNWHEISRKITSSSGVYTASNGLTMTANNTVLGGTLTQVTTIDAGTLYSLNVTGNSSSNILSSVNSGSGTGTSGTSNSGNGLSGVSTSGNAVSATSTSGPGVNAFSLSSTAVVGLSTNGLGGYFKSNPSSTNTQVEVMRVERLTTGTAANSMAGSLGMYLEDNSANTRLANEMVSTWTTAATATRTSQLKFTGVNSATTTDLFTLSGNGAARLNQYGIGTFTGTTAFGLGVDASGNVIEISPAGGVTADNGLTVSSGSNVRLGGTLIVNPTTIAAGANTLSVTTSTGGATPFLVSSTTGNATSISATDGTAVNAFTTGFGTAVYGVAESGGGVAGGSRTGYGGDFNVFPTSTNTSVPVVNVYRSTTGTAAAGMGGYINLQLKDASNNTQDAGEVQFVWTDPATATRTSKLVLTTVNSGTLTDVLVISGTGATRMPFYGAGAATFDGSGNITSVSDERLKNINGYYRGGLSEIMKVNPIIYHWNDLSKMDRKNTYIGFSAQNIEFALGENAIGRNSEGYMSIQDRAIMAAMVRAIQEQQKEIEWLKKQLRK